MLTSLANQLALNIGNRLQISLANKFLRSLQDTNYLLQVCPNSIHSKTHIGMILVNWYLSLLATFSPTLCFYQLSLLYQEHKHHFKSWYNILSMSVIVSVYQLNYFRKDRGNIL